MTNYHRKTKYVEEMETDDKLVKINESLKQEIRNFFYSLYRKELS